MPSPMLHHIGANSDLRILGVALIVVALLFLAIPAVVITLKAGTALVSSLLMSPLSLSAGIVCLMGD